MQRPLALAAAAALATFAAAAAPTPAQPIREAGVCLNLRNVHGGVLADPRNYLVRGDGNRIFRIEFQGDCHTAGTYPLILHPFNNDSTVCSALQLNVRVRDTGEVCIPKSISVLTPEEAAALPPGSRP